ncbi:DUF3274 domain-containing protein [Cupriavidus sp. WKF15]|uniref:T6SS effector phospholipase Tle3 domain-containing protein n=1 Tax=Cupriavidus sp. WKF15 TaxID=3032282 RepID=UPI0023E16567|nr:DUF3274 domain-containing protein [Cupriavidus sp. WKF15]WER49312.1 DUF3274 domain-containing protein [Cupriavidus sp. WKF15]
MSENSNSERTEVDADNEVTAPPRDWRREATRVVPMQRDVNGNPFWESYLTPTSFCVRAEAQIPPHMPGVVIFVHGVNSEGEWYDTAEDALCAGLNERLGLEDTDFKLKPNKYVDRDPDKKKMHERRYNSEEPGNSPVIRFYWGYREPDEHQGRYKVPLRNLKGVDFQKRTENDSGPWFWGGGAFQNGTNNLQQMWSHKGFDRTILSIVDLQLLNTEPERQLQNAPLRDYYPHAAKRLANLIDKIRSSYPHDTVTIMSHSQGTMIAMAATALCETRAPDALFVMNSPFALDDKPTDFAACGNNRPTAEARVRTFCNIANRIKGERRMLDDRLKGLLAVGKGPDGERWHPDIQITLEIKERDNHGRLYVYFSPHDRVMGLTSLQSIGWQGVNDTLIDLLGDTVKQRMLARLTPCGDVPGQKPYGTLPDMKGGRLYDPDHPKEFWDGNRGPFFNAVKLWAVPHANQKVTINAEQVPKPLTAEETRRFDVSVTDPLVNEMGATDPDTGQYLERDYPYFESIQEPEQYLDRGADIYNDGRRVRTKETVEEARNRLKHHKAEPTDHSTLPMNRKFMQRVAAYDLPIGFCESFDDRAFWRGLMMDADWTQCTDAYFENGVLLKPDMPTAYVDKEIVSDAIERAQAEREKRERH